MNDAKILISYHKDMPHIHSDTLISVHAGRALSGNCAGNIGLGDDSGDNISCTNRYYSEMTTVYWAWKNYDQLQNPEYIGFFHYRRFLDLRSSKPDMTIVKKIKNLHQFGLDSGNILDICRQYDIVLPYPDTVLNEDGKPLTVKEHYAKNHFPQDFDLLTDILHKRYPEYTNLIEDTVNSVQSVYCNIFIMKKDFFFKYCEFCFDILFEMEKRINIEEERFKNDGYQHRVYGFLAERILNFFIAIENAVAPLKIKRSRMIFINPDLTFLENIRNYLVILARKASFVLYREDEMYKISFGKFILIKKSSSQKEFLNGLIKIKQ